MQLAEGESAPFALIYCQLHPLSIGAWSSSQCCGFLLLDRFELWHLCGLDGLHARGGGLLAGDDIGFQ